MDRCLPENSTYITFQHFVVDSQLFGLRKSSDAVAAVAATAPIAFSSFSVFCQFVFFHLQNKLLHTNKANKTKMHRVQMAETPGHFINLVTLFSLSLLFLFLLLDPFFFLFFKKLAKWCCCSKNNKYSYCCGFFSFVVVVVVSLLQIFFPLLLLRKNTPAMNEEAQGHKVCMLLLALCLPPVLACCNRDRGRGRVTHRERHTDRKRERLGNDVVSSVF